LETIITGAAIKVVARAEGVVCGVGCIDNTCYAVVTRVSDDAFSASQPRDDVGVCSERFSLSNAQLDDLKWNYSEINYQIDLDPPHTH
jgi:hypothetical protein